MSDDRRETIYQTWRKSWHPRARRSQVALALVVIAATIAAIGLHWFLVTSPGLTVDLARLDLPYRPWYLGQQPAVATGAIGAGQVSPAAAVARPGSPAAAKGNYLVPRPDLVPQAGDWDAAKLRNAVLAYVSQEAQAAGGKAEEPGAAANAVAQELAEKYAAGGPQAIAGEYETSLLANGWLWNVWRGCEAGAYLSFPPGSLREMSCVPDAFPTGLARGLGVARWRGPLGEEAPVFAWVWRNSGGGAK